MSTKNVVLNDEHAKLTRYTHAKILSNTFHLPVVKLIESMILATSMIVTRYTHAKPIV